MMGMNDQCYCENCRPVNGVECMLSMARLFNGDLIVAENVTDLHIARVRVALDFQRRPLIAFRAMVEDWGIQQIIRELY